MKLRVLGAALFDWIINPIPLFISTVGGNFTVDTTAVKADSTAHTCDAITI